MSERINAEPKIGIKYYRTKNFPIYRESSCWRHPLTAGGGVFSWVGWWAKIFFCLSENPEIKLDAEWDKLKINVGGIIENIFNHVSLFGKNLNRVHCVI